MRSHDGSDNLCLQNVLIIFYIPQLDQTQLGMPGRQYFLKERDAKPLMAYQTFATEAANMLGADPRTAERDMREMIDFEIRLANVRLVKCVLRKAIQSDNTM